MSSYKQKSEPSQPLVGKWPSKNKETRDTNIARSKDVNVHQRWSRGHKARGQGHKKNPRSRPAFPRTDTLEAKDRNARGQGQGPRTQAQVLFKKKKTSSQKFFRRSPQNFNNSKNTAVLEPRTGQFSRTWGLEAKAKDFKMCPRGLHLCCSFWW